MKRITAVLLTIVLLFSAAGCAESGLNLREDSNDNLNSETEQTIDANEETTLPDQEIYDSSESATTREVIGQVKAEVVPDAEDSCIASNGAVLMDMDVDTLFVAIPGNDEAAQKIMAVFQKQKETCYSNCRELVGDMSSPLPGVTMFDELALTVTRADQSVISVYGMETLYLGGAHPNSHGIMGKTFSVETGEELQFADLTGQKDVLLQVLHDECLRQANDRAEEELGYSEVVKNDDFRSKFETEVFIWTLDSEGIHIYFPEYTISSIYAAGIIEFVVPYSNITDYIYDWVIPS